MFSTFTGLQAFIIISEELIPASMHSINVFFLLRRTIWAKCSINHTSFSICLLDNTSQVQRHIHEAKTIKWSLKKMWSLLEERQTAHHRLPGVAALPSQHTLLTLIYLLFQIFFANRNIINQRQFHSPCKHLPISLPTGNCKQFAPAELWTELHFLAQLPSHPAPRTTFLGRSCTNPGYPQHGCFSS